MKLSGSIIALSAGFGLAMLSSAAIAQDGVADTPPPPLMLPMSDQGNEGSWVLNPAMSDEFEGDAIDQDKWFVQGVDDQYYIWAGRAPSQFVSHNVIVEDGFLTLRTQWEPEFEFQEAGYAGNTYGDPVPVTTAAIISNERFLYGYMEARTRSADASISSSFWMIGYESELDVLESMGRPGQPSNRRRSYMFNGASHDWRPGHFVPEVGQNRVIEGDVPMLWDLADAFHVYGAEWDPEFVRFFVDGEMVSEVRKEDVDGWVLTNPLEVWLDNPHFELPPIDLTGLTVDEWNRVSVDFTRPVGSSESDLLKLSVHRDNVTEGSSRVYFDDIVIVAR